MLVSTSVSHESMRLSLYVANSLDDKKIKQTTFFWLAEQKRSEAAFSAQRQRASLRIRLLSWKSKELLRYGVHKQPTTEVTFC